MSDNRKYYYLKLKDNFFDSEELIVVESMENGYIFSNILLKLYLKSLRNDGKLLINNRIPYNPTLIAKVIRHNPVMVEKALQILEQLGLIEVLKNGTIYMSDIQSLIGKSSTEADRKREYRKRIETEKGQMSQLCPLEIEKDKELELDNSQ